MTRRPARVGLLVIAVIGLGGCAMLKTRGEKTQDAGQRVGRALAQERCLTCHAVETSDGAAPSLTDIARKYRQFRLDWELETITQVGHYQMPARALSKQEIRDLAIYIRGLDR